LSGDAEIRVCFETIFSPRDITAATATNKYLPLQERERERGGGEWARERNTRVIGIYSNVHFPARSPTPFSYSSETSFRGVREGRRTKKRARGNGVASREPKLL